MAPSGWHVCIRSSLLEDSDPPVVPRGALALLQVWRNVDEQVHAEEVMKIINERKPPSLS